MYGIVIGAALLALLGIVVWTPEDEDEDDHFWDLQP
jgi:hypothetical protein